nr:hypothetical protein [Tanacetum cinerariifolium]
MASAVIRLSKRQKFNFSKYIFDSLAPNVDSSSKFYMYPRFIQLIIQNQVRDLSTHTTRFISPALTQKVFANMRRVGKGFSRVETPLFEIMLVARQPTEEGLVDKQIQVDDVVAAAVEENVAKDVAHDAIPSPPSHTIPSLSQEPSSPPQQPQSTPQAPPQEAGNYQAEGKSKECMRTRRSYFPITTNVTIPRRRQRKQTSNVVEPEIRTIVEMADNRTMAQMLQAPIEGYEDAIVVPPINANNFELKQMLINLVQSNQFTGRQDPHNHLRFFNKVTSTFRHPEVSNTTIKLLLFPISLEGEARTWLDKEPPRSILTWEDLVLKFINQFFPPSKTTYLRNEITNFLQKPNETFNEAWENFKDLLRQCPHHGFSEVHQLDTFYNALNPNDQDALDSAVGGNFLDKIPRECLSIIESKSKVRYSRSQFTDSRANTNAPPFSSLPSHSFDLQQIAASLEDKLDIRMSRFEKSLNDMKAFITPTAPIKAVEEVCVTCGANHSYNHCPLTRGNEFPVFHDNIQQFQTAAVGNFIQGNHHHNISNQMRPPGFNQPNQNNQNCYQGNNFNSNQNRQNNKGAVDQNRPQQTPTYQAPAQKNAVTNSKFKAYTNANDANMNNLQIKFDNFQKN